MGLSTSSRLTTPITSPLFQSNQLHQSQKNEIQVSGHQRRTSKHNYRSIFGYILTVSSVILHFSGADITGGLALFLNYSSPFFFISAASTNYRWYPCNPRYLSVIFVLSIYILVLNCLITQFYQQGYFCSAVRPSPFWKLEPVLLIAVVFFSLIAMHYSWSENCFSLEISFDQILTELTVEIIRGCMFLLINLSSSKTIADPETRRLTFRL